MLEKLLPDIDRHYSTQTRELFFQKFQTAGLLAPLKVPLMVYNKNDHVNRVVTRSLGQVNFEKICKLSVSNTTNEPVKILASTNFFEIKSLEQVFQHFVAVTRHANRFQHFRDFPEYYAKVLQDARYFYFHGDGFCTKLALLFQALVRKVLDLKITAMYCRTDDFKFSHGYCLYNQGTEKIYIDPDLKGFFPYTRFQNFQPASWFLNFIENIAIYNYHKLSQAQQTEMFYDFACDYFQWLYTCCDRELSLPNSDYNVTLDLLHTTLPSQSEVFDIFADDYPWKSKFRQAASAYGATDKQVIFQNLDKPFPIFLPANSTLEINPKDELDDYNTQIAKYYFGRVAAALRINLEANVGKTITLPEIPWTLAITKGTAQQIRFNDYELIFNDEMVVKNIPFRGMGALNTVVRSFWTEGLVTLHSSSACELSIYFPINASFWNSNLLMLQMEENPGVNIEAFYLE